jgi:hypothetical protein
MQNELQMKYGKNKMVEDRPMVLITTKKLELIPSIFDYELNVCYKRASFQWLRAFESNLDFKRNITLKIDDTIDDLFNVVINTYFKGDVLA